MGNLYVYGRPSGPMTAHSPLAATDVKGRLRIRMWQDALAARAAGRVRVTEARASDFVGPTVPPAQSHLVRQLDTVRRGRRAWVIGDPDAQHSWSYIPDVAATLATLGTDPRAEGRAWHVPTTPPRSQRQALADLARAMGVEPKGVSGVPWPLLRAAGVAVPLVRELVDIRHQWDAPFVLDSAETTEVFGLPPTPWDDVVRATAGAAATRV
jgi:nucleoside-diphosphate-sugar epimerase